MAPTSELPIFIVTQVVLKTVYEIVVLPVTIYVVRKTKQIEDEDSYDTDMNYSVWKVLSV